MASRIEIKTDANNLNAFLIFRPIEGYDKPISADEVDQVLTIWKVKHGIDQSAVERFIQLNTPDIPVPFAKGVPPKESHDAEIIYNFDFEKLKTYSTGKVDKLHKSIYKDFIVKKGLLIAKRIPPQEGESGIDVFGKEILPKKPKDTTLKKLQGENTVVDPTDTKLVALKEGILRFEKDKVHVDQILIISGELDAGVGNIDFEGTVIIEGTIKPGFIVKAREDIKVNDIVEAATLVAGRDIEIQAGIKGRGKAFLSAGRDIKVRFAENAEFEAGRDIIIDSASVNSTLKAKNSLRIEGHPGELVGGFASAGHELVANQIGSNMNLKTSVEVGIDPSQREKIMLLQSQIKVDEENVQKLQLIAKKLKSLREQLKDQFPKDKLDMLLKSIQTINNLNVEIPKLKLELAETEKKIELMVSGAKIIAKQILYAGTEITIRDRKFYANRDYEKAILVLEGGEIRIGGYSQ
ncbi:MAG TPA: FapA family protein [Thermotogota bacterium]|nr:FapA family protein [Thermotogota bacterium]